MNDYIAQAFRRAAKHSPLMQRYRLYRKDKVPLDLSGLTEEERRFAKSDTATVFDWLETLAGALEWKETGADGKTAQGVLTLYGEPLSQAPEAVLATDGTWLVVDEALGRDSLSASFKLEVRRWTANDAPRVRSDEP